MIVFGMVWVLMLNCIWIICVNKKIGKLYVKIFLFFLENNSKEEIFIDIIYNN